MKKLKRNNSLGHKSKLKGKAPNEPKTGNSKKHIAAKKQVLQKENRSFFEEKSLNLLPKKKTNHKQKQKQRSKSLLYCRAQPSNLPYQSTHRPALVDYPKNRAEKEDTDISGNINSRYVKEICQIQPFISNFHSPYHKERDAQAFSYLQVPLQHSPGLVQSLKKDLEIVNEQKKRIGQQNQTIKEQNGWLKLRTSQLEIKIQVINTQAKVKLKQAQLTYKHEKQQLISQVTSLRIDKENLSQLKYNLECIVSDQKEQILSLKQQKCLLQIECKQGQRFRMELAADNKKSKIKIESLEKQLINFENNLEQFGKLKHSYQSRLSHLEEQKKKIKENASQLLVLVQRYQIEENR